MAALEKECCRENGPVRGLALAVTVSPEPVAVLALPASGAIEIEFASGARLRIVGTLDPMAGCARMHCARSILAFPRGAAASEPKDDLQLFHGKRLWRKYEALPRAFGS